LKHGAAAVFGGLDKTARDASLSCLVLIMKS
jgi:hypothetical protein